MDLLLQILVSAVLSVLPATSKVLFHFERATSTLDTAPSNFTGVWDMGIGRHTKVVGGRPANLGEYPWIVALIKDGRQFCGGSLIDSQNVLTAAHCVAPDGRPYQSLTMHIGDLDLSTNQEATHLVRTAKSILYHKGFDWNTLVHDIALIHLDRPVPFSVGTIEPVSLNEGTTPYDTGRIYADVIGWGSNYHQGPTSSKLITANLRVQTQKECSGSYARVGRQIYPGMVCAGSPSKDSCNRDSGGPLVLQSAAGGKAKQIGIVSWGEKCGQIAGVYTRVDKYMDWINKNKLKV